MTGYRNLAVSNCCRGLNSEYNVHVIHSRVNSVLMLKLDCMGMELLSMFLI